MRSQHHISKIFRHPLLTSLLMILVLFGVELYVNKSHKPFTDIPMLTLAYLRMAIYAVLMPPFLYFEVYKPLKKYIRNLTKAEEKYRTLLYEMNEGFSLMEVLFNKNGEAEDFRFLETNKEFEKQTGLTQVTGKRRLEVEPHPKDDLIALCGEVIKTGDPIHTTLHIPSMDRYFDMKLFQAGNRSSNIVAALFENITEQKKAAETLRISEERFFKAFRNAPFAGLIIRMADLQVIEVNASFLTLFEFEQDDVIRHTTRELNIYKDLPKREDFIKRVNREGSVNSEEIEMQTRTGRKLNILLSAQKIRIGDEDHHYVIYVDITDRKKIEEDLRLSEARHRKLFELDICGVVYWNVNGQIYDANDYFLELTGYTREDLAQGLVRWNEITPEEYRLGDLQRIQDMKELGNNKVPIEKEYIRKDGKRVPILVSGALFDKQGKDGVAFVLDITDRKRWENQLRSSEERFSKAFLKGGFGALILRASDFRCVEVNSTYLKMFGYSREEIIGKTSRDLPLFADLRDRDEMIGKVMSQGYFKNKELEMCTKTGELKNILISAQKIQMSGEEYIYLNYADITDRKKAEEALRLSEQRWVTTLTSLNEAVIATDSAGKVTFINPEAECLTGWRKEEVLNRPVHEFYHIIDEFTRERIEDPVNYFLNNGIKYRAIENTLLIRKQGEEVPIEESGAPIKSGNEQILGCVLIFHDVTQRKNLERQLKEYSAELEKKVNVRTAELALAKEEAESADRLKTSFLLTMSHELRTPLNSIIGFSGILQSGLAGSLNPEQKKQVSMILHSGRHLLSLVNDILDMSKIEVGQLAVYFENFNPASVIEQVLEGEQQLAENKGLALELIQKEINIVVHSDPARFHQVILNLVHNAIKFTERGSVKVLVGMEDGYIRIDVQDTGIGISEENMKKLFISFAQIDNDLVRRNQGTGSGLGLAISKKIMELLHGTITVQSTKGVGSVFTVRMPLS